MQLLLHLVHPPNLAVCRDEGIEGCRVGFNTCLHHLTMYLKAGLPLIAGVASYHEGVESSGHW
jgi:hypothetical protein